MEKYMVDIDNVTKRYILGQIGGTTLHEEIQRRIAKKRGKEDPTQKIGAKSYADGEEFWALNGVSFKVKPGERVGIIGHNGAGKSTLLKLLSRVTAPTTGEIGLNGRVTSMLEVGTGFNGELTGRENIYMNGAILGMTKKEIDAKIEDIIAFSECGQFIDTPVKRYSSGMYVKLAFSVAAHLDSEIMIMDEVLAVGDMAFQKKCLDKMNDVSRTQGRTILYVSHNMNTIRQLCQRVVVLDHGTVVFDGDVEEGISLYMGDSFVSCTHNDFSYREYDPYITANIQIHYLELKQDTNLLLFGSKLRFEIEYESKINLDYLCFRFTILTPDRTAVATTTTQPTRCIQSTNHILTCEIDTHSLAPTDYIMQIVAFEPDNFGGQIRHDYIPNAAAFRIYSDESQLNNFTWDIRAWGHQVLKVEVE